MFKTMPNCGNYKQNGIDVLKPTDMFPITCARVKQSGIILFTTFSPDSSMVAVGTSNNKVYVLPSVNPVRITVFKTSS
jgi:hypothetical protein